jgi:tetratricopeptide (TPR) repeat protein
MVPPSFPARGRIEEHSLAAVLLALLRDGRDGCLTVSRGGITRRLYLRGGMIVYSSSTKRSDRLGEILIAQGKLSRADHRRYWEQSRSGNRKLGITLVLNGVITLSDLYQAVSAQVVTILDRLQKMRSGEFVFEEGRRPAPGTVLLRIPLALYLHAGARQRAGRRALERSGGAAGPVPGRGEGAAEEEPIVLGEEDLGPEAAISFEEARRLESVGEVSFLVQELRRRLEGGPHALLGVREDADAGAAQAAHAKIGAVLGPGRLPPGCPAGLEREATEIFGRVTEALEALVGGRRRRQLAAVPLPPGRVVPKAEADPSRRYWVIGREWLAKRNYWQAADALRQAVRLRPEDPTFRQQLGLALMQIKRLPEAEEHLLEAARLEPDNPAHLVALGRVYRAGRLYRKAREAFQRAQRIDPSSRAAREELADLPVEEGRRGNGLIRKIFR